MFREDPSLEYLDDGSLSSSHLLVVRQLEEEIRSALFCHYGHVRIRVCMICQIHRGTQTQVSAQESRLHGRGKESLSSPDGFDITTSLRNGTRGDKPIEKRTLPTTYTSSPQTLRRVFPSPDRRIVVQYRQDKVDDRLLIVLFDICRNHIDPGSSSSRRPELAIDGPPFILPIHLRMQLLRGLKGTPVRRGLATVQHARARQPHGSGTDRHDQLCLLCSLLEEFIGCRGTMGEERSANDEDVEVARGCVVRAGRDDFDRGGHHGWFEGGRDIVEGHLDAHATKGLGEGIARLLDIIGGETSEQVNGGDVGELNGLHHNADLKSGHG